MYGPYTIPFTIDHDRFSLQLGTQAKAGAAVDYRRTLDEEEVEKQLVMDTDQLTIEPVEPVNLPKEITPHLCIEFEHPIMLGPRGRQRVYLTVPIEIGILARQNAVLEDIDCFSLSKIKYTLYGEIQSGVLCRHWASPVYCDRPSPDPLYEGVLALDIVNRAQRWCELTQAVFEAGGMRLYYSKKIVTMRAKMRLLSDILAETEFYDQPLIKGMTKATELYTAKRIPGIATKFVMESGF